MCELELNSILCVTNRALCRRPFEEQMEIVCALHPRAVILREKDLSESNYEALARKILPICNRHHVPLIPHFYPKAARALGLRRIHLPLWKLREVTGYSVDSSNTRKHHEVESCKSSFDSPSSRSVDFGSSPAYGIGIESSSDCSVDFESSSGCSVGFESSSTHDGFDFPLTYNAGSMKAFRTSFDEIGCSIHSVEEAQDAVRMGATYLSAGHIFETDCKKGLPPRGLAFLRDVCASVPVPVYAIGGIHLDSAQLELVRNCGAAGACIMSGLMKM